MVTRTVPGEVAPKPKQRGKKKPIPFALCFAENRRMCAVGFIEGIEMAVSNLTAQKCFNNKINQQKKKNHQKKASCDGKEEEIDVVPAAEGRAGSMERGRAVCKLGYEKPQPSQSWESVGGLPAVPRGRRASLSGEWSGWVLGKTPPQQEW